MSSTEKNVQHLLNELGRALTDAIATSDDVSDAVRRIRAQGYALNLTLDCEQDGRGRARVSVPARAQRERKHESPSFRLDGQDVAILKSLGIDATRPARRRRS